MSEVVPFEAGSEDLRELTLLKLLRIAEQYGNVTVYSGRSERPPKCYRVKITFDAVPGTEVEAASDFEMEIHEAFIMAIENAQKIARAYR